MSAMNIDRPLDEIVKESVAARKAARQAKRKEIAQTKKTKGTDSAAVQKSSPVPAQKLGVAKKEGSISKKQRRRERRAAFTTAAASGADEENRRTNGNTNNPRPNGNAPRPQSRNDKPFRNDKAPRSSQHQGGLANRLSTKASGNAARRATPKGVKIRVSNLHPGVTETDIGELFETVGPIKKAHLKTFANGHSACEAEVIFERMADALEAINRYNQVPLDNHPLHITLATDSIASTAGHEPIHNRVGKPRARNHNPRNSEYADEPDSPNSANVYSEQRSGSPENDRDRQGGGRGRQNRRRVNKRYQNRGPNGNGNGNRNGADRGDHGERDSYD